MIYSLIISVVILSLFLVSTLPSNAASTDITLHFAGEDLYDLLKFYYVTVYVKDDINDEYEAVDNDTFQVVLGQSGDNVYLYLTSLGPLRGKFIRLQFDSQLGADIAPLITDFQTTIYKRYDPYNGDDGTPDHQGRFTVSILSSVQLESYSQTVELSGDNSPGLVSFDYPFVNNVVVDGRTYIDTDNPFLTNDPSSPHYGHYIESSSVPMYFHYNPKDAFGIDYDGIGFFDLEYYSGLNYDKNAVAFCFTPITFTLVNTEWVEQWGWLRNMTHEDLNDYIYSKNIADISKDFLENNSSSLNGYTDFVDTNQDRPNIDMNYLLNLDNIGALSSGISSFASGSAPLFQDSAFFNIFPIIAAPPLVISYLLFGKKG